MKIYLVERTDNWSYDDYDKFICTANSEEEAKLLSPDEYRIYRDGKFYFQFSDGTEKEDKYSTWTTPDNVKVTEIIPTENKIILSSYNAG